MKTCAPNRPESCGGVGGVVFSPPDLLPPAGLALSLGYCAPGEDYFLQIDVLSPYFLLDDDAPRPPTAEYLRYWELAV